MATKTNVLRVITCGTGRVEVTRDRAGLAAFCSCGWFEFGSDVDGLSTRSVWHVETVGHFVPGQAGARIEVQA